MTRLKKKTEKIIDLNKKINFIKNRFKIMYIHLDPMGLLLLAETN